MHLFQIPNKQNSHWKHSKTQDQKVKEKKMQSLVRKLTVITRNLHHHHKPNLSFKSHRQSHFAGESSHLTHHIPSSSSFPIHHFHSWRSISSKTIAQQFSFTSRNYISTLFSKRLINRSFHKGHFHRQSFYINMNGNFNSRRRGWRSWFNRLSPNDMVLGLIVANVAVFLFWRIASEKFMLNNFTLSLDNIKSGRLHTLITSAFSHIDTWHIISNMIGLYFFGVNIGNRFGSGFLLKLYLAGAIGGSVFYLVHQAYKAQTSKGWGAINPSKEFALGASGAVNAIMLLNIFLNPTATIYLDFFIPVPAALLGIFLIGKDMLRIIEGDKTISGSAHLGGVAVAAIAWAGVRRGRF